MKVTLSGLHATANTEGKASVKINGKVVEWDVKTATVTKLAEGAITFKVALKNAGFGEDDFTIDYSDAASITITAAAAGKNVIKGFKVTGEAAMETAKFEKDATDNGRGVNKKRYP